MKAVILAGGFATRLRPLSCTRPKLLFPIGNKPLLDWTLGMLVKIHVQEVTLATNCMVTTLIKHYGRSKNGVHLFYSVEEEPLGTGGAIKNAEKSIRDQEPFLVLNGDVFTDFDCAELLKRHKESDSIATIALHRVEDPSRYGAVELTGENRVARFVEKPTGGEARSNLISAGVYVFNSQIFDYIPSGRPVSIEREIFPELANDEKISGCIFDGMWIDIGEPRDYLKANRLLLDVKMKSDRIEEYSSMGTGVNIQRPAIIDEEVTVGEKSELGPHVAIGKNVTVGKGVHIENSVVLSQAEISDSTLVRGAIVGEGAVIGSSVRIDEDCVIGDHAEIGDSVTLAQGVTVCPFRKVSESVYTSKCLM